MSFKSRQTSLTNLSSVTDRMETFEPLAMERNDIYYQRPLSPKSYIPEYVVKVAAVLFVLTSLCIHCYLITTVSHLQSIINDKNGIRSNLQDEKGKLENVDAMLHKVEKKSNILSEQMQTFQQNVNTDVENLKKLIHLQSTVVTNANSNLNELRSQMKLERGETNNLEKTIQKMLLEYNVNVTSKGNDSVKPQLPNPNPFNETNLVDTNWKVATNFSFERMNRIERELEKINEVTKQNSKLLQNVEINSNSQVFMNFSRNATHGVLADVDTLILNMKESLNKLKFAMPVPNSCHMYQAYGATESGNYLIDPDGVGNNKPFKAFCDFDNGYTVVQHSSPETELIPKCEGTNCYKKFLHYPASKFQLQRLTNISSYCFQDIQFDCYSAQLKKAASWLDVNGHANQVDKCECSKVSQCHRSIDNNSCNCDALPSVHDWLNDTIKVTTRPLLPITGFRYGFLRNQASYTVGSLHCKGGPSPIDITELKEDVIKLMKERINDRRTPTSSRQEFQGSFCSCKDFVNDGGFGNCFKRSGHSKHGGNVVCYVEQPSTCSDLIESKANPGEKVSAEACKLKADCSCSDFVSSSGYGNCQKSYKHGPFCYVNQPSTCKDLVGSKEFRQKQYSWEACQNE